MNLLAPHEASDHLPLATLPGLPKQCNHCGKNFLRQSSLFKHVLVVHGASCPLEILTKLMALYLLDHLQDKD